MKPTDDRPPGVTSPGETPGVPPPGDAPRADDHHGIGQPDPQAVKQGYENDGYDKTSVVSVAALVLLFFLLAFTTTTIMFWGFGGSNTDTAELDNQIRQIGRNTPNGQPRLEAFEVRGPEAQAMPHPAIPDPTNVRRIHPEANRANTANTPELYREGDAGQGRVYVPIDVIIAAPEQTKLYPVRKGGERPRDSQHVPTAANAARGAGPSAVVLPEPPELPAAKPGEKKTEEKNAQPPDGKKTPDAKEGQD
jgi:hypothetical protein